MSLEEIRLQAFMAKCGVASRRKSEEMILKGVVTVNGKVVKELGTKVTRNDKVLVNGSSIYKEEPVYFALNKPLGFVTTTNDEFDRKTVLDLFHKADLVNRIYPIGRLDYDTQGLLLLTNDGELANKLISPKSDIEKEYRARVEGLFGMRELSALMKGVEIDGYKTKPSIVEIISTDKKNNSSLVKIIITEGKNHQVRKMCEKVGHPVKKLTRVRFGTISIVDLAQGEYRSLKPHEVKQLYSL
ncbi:MAG: pseudouridine synthase [bacterium]